MGIRDVFDRLKGKGGADKKPTPTPPPQRADRNLDESTVHVRLDDDDRDMLSGGAGDDPAGPEFDPNATQLVPGADDTEPKPGSSAPHPAADPEAVRLGQEETFVAPVSGRPEPSEPREKAPPEEQPLAETRILPNLSSAGTPGQGLPPAPRVTPVPDPQPPPNRVGGEKVGSADEPTSAPSVRPVAPSPRSSQSGRDFVPRPSVNTSPPPTVNPPRRAREVQREEPEIAPTPSTRPPSPSEEPTEYIAPDRTGSNKLAGVIVGIYGAAKGQIFAISDGERKVGRSDSCDVPIMDPKISREHAMMRCSDGYVRIESIADRNPIYINDSQIEGEAVLSDGDKLQLGNAGTSIFRFRTIPGL